MCAHSCSWHTYDVCFYPVGLYWGWKSTFKPICFRLCWCNYVFLLVDPDCGPVGSGRLSLHCFGLQFLQEVLQQEWWQGQPRHEVQWHAYCEFSLHIRTNAPTLVCLSTYIFFPLYPAMLIFLVPIQPLASFSTTSDWEGLRRILTVIPFVGVRTASSFFHYFSLKWWTHGYKTAPQASV